MRRRGWRVALTLATVGLALVAGLVALNWQTVRNHAEAWWFVATRDVKTVNPDPDSKVIANETWATFVRRHRPELTYKKQLEPFLQDIANYTDKPIVFDPSYSVWTFIVGIKFREDDTLASLLHGNGFQLVEQRFPHRAYVVIGSSSWREREEVR